VSVFTDSLPYRAYLSGSTTQAYFCWSWVTPTSDSRQLRTLGHHWVHLPICNTEKTFLVLGKIQLYVLAVPHALHQVSDKHSMRKDILSAALDAGTAIAVLLVYFW
jgi:hypothetical protein